MLKPEVAPHTIRVFVGSPEDVAPERAILARVVAETNDTLETFELPLRLQLRRWETHTAPKAGSAQNAINQQIGEYEIFIGIMWTRFGTRTENAGSGTEEEYNRAYELWQQRGEPYIMFYFSETAARPAHSEKEAKQIMRVAAFRERIAKQQYYATYKGRRDFEGKIRQHLLIVLKKFWNDLRAAERKQSDVVDEARREIRDAINNLLPAAAAHASAPEPERFSPEEVNALRALLARVARATAPPMSTTAAPEEPKDEPKKGDDDASG